MFTHLDGHGAAGDHVGLDAIRVRLVGEAIDLPVGCKTAHRTGVGNEGYGGNETSSVSSC